MNPVIYSLFAIYIAMGAAMVIWQWVNREWFMNLLDRINEMEPGFRTSALEYGMRLGETPQEAEFKANVILFFAWPLFVYAYTRMYFAVRDFEKYHEQMDYLEEKREAMVDAWNLPLDTPDREDIVWAAEMNFRAAHKRAFHVPWHTRVWNRIRYGKVPELIPTGGIFSDDPVENTRLYETGNKVLQVSGCAAHDIPVLACPECRALPEVQEIVDGLKRDGVIGTVEESTMPMIEGKRERRVFRLEFDENGRVGPDAKFMIQHPKVVECPYCHAKPGEFCTRARSRTRVGDDPGDVGTGEFFHGERTKAVQESGPVADCCVDCAQSDQSAYVTETSENARQYMGIVHARSSFLVPEVRQRQEPFTTDGKAGFVSGYLIRDVC